MILEVKNLSVNYGNKKIIDNVTFSLEHGEILVIAGESGSGKSTILKAVDGLLENNGRISGGKIIFDGVDITNFSGEDRRKISGAEIAMIFQNSGSSFCPIRTIGEQIYESVVEHQNLTEKDFREKAKLIMKNINLPESTLDEFPFRLSGGMSQRAGILAAMILNPKLLLADEPTSALDTVTQVSVVKELIALRKRNGISIVMVTHHLGLAWYMADKILILKDGQAVEYGTKEKIFNNPQEIYTRELINSVPRLDKRSA